MPISWWVKNTDFSSKSTLILRFRCRTSCRASLQLQPEVSLIDLSKKEGWSLGFFIKCFFPEKIEAWKRWFYLCEKLWSLDVFLDFLNQWAKNPCFVIWKVGLSFTLLLAPGNCHLLRSPVVSTSSVELAKVLERRIGVFVVGTNVAGVSNFKIKCDMYTVWLYCMTCTLLTYM